MTQKNRQNPQGSEVLKAWLKSRKENFHRSAGFHFSQIGVGGQLILSSHDGYFSLPMMIQTENGSSYL